MIQFTGDIHIKMGEGVLDIRFQPEITNVACENTDDQVDSIEDIVEAVEGDNDSTDAE